MHAVITFISQVLKITLLDLTLSSDNLGVIALATKNLPEKYAKKASLIGVICAVSLIIIFASFISLIMSVKWLPLKLIGGLLLIKITWDFVKPHEEDEEEKAIKTSNKFWGAIATIIIADLSMSLDNVLAIAAAAQGKVEFIAFGIALNIPILFFGSQYISGLMKKYPIIIYIGAAILAHTSFKMICEDVFVAPYLPHVFALILPWLAAMLVFGYGVYLIRKTAKPRQV